MLTAVAERLPWLYRFCHLAYSQHSILKFGTHSIKSAEGAQQGDPLGPQLFCLSVHPLLASLNSVLNITYMADVTLGGPGHIVTEDVDTIRQKGPCMDLTSTRPNAKSY